MTPNSSDASSIIETVKELANPQLVNVSRGTDSSAAFVAVPKDMRTESIKKYLDEYLAKPERLSGTSTHTTIESFISHANTFKALDGRSVIFANPDARELTAIYDYNSNNDPRFAEHRAVFSPKLSRQWKVWTEESEPMNQADFADFIETNALDLIDPPTSSSSDPSDAAILSIARTLNTTIASASNIITLARGISINEDSKAKSYYDPSTGQRSIEYTTEHKDASGAKLTVPGLFLIAIPVFDGGASYRMVARLRYRLTQGIVTWFVQLYQPEKCLEDAFEEICGAAAQGTSLPVYRGRAES